MKDASFASALSATIPFFLSSPRRPVLPFMAPHQAMCRRSGRTTTVTAKASVSTPQRRSGNYQPTLWDAEFVQSLPSDDCDEIHVGLNGMTKHEVLKGEVRRMLVDMAATSTLVSFLELVDAVQQLGLGYRFEKEIKDALDSISVNRNEVLLLGDLHSTALLFRVFRENGYDISQDVFLKFVDEHGGFQKCCGREIQGVLSLYEATFYALEGEKLLDEAKSFSKERLQVLQKESERSFEEKIRHSLELPIHWRMPRLHTRWFMDVYSKEEHMNPTLLELAKIDFYMLQNVHRKDLKELSRWYTGLDLGEKLPFARDRLVENFLWSMGMLHEPQHSYFRFCMSQLITFVTLIDDVYDVYGSMDELELFTDAIERWDLKAMEQLPDYMKICYLALFNTVNETSYQILKEKAVDVTPYLKNAWANLCKSYLLEAKWYNSHHVPTVEQYINNAFVTISAPLMIVYTYILTCKDINAETLESLDNYPNFISSVSIINRLNDDMGTSTEELKRGDVHKAIQCYMHHENASEEVAREEIRSLISETWKKVNKERFEVAPALPKPLVDGAVNLSRTFHCFYRDGDGYGSPDKETRDQIMSLLVDSI